MTTDVNKRLKIYRSFHLNPSISTHIRNSLLDLGLGDHGRISIIINFSSELANIDHTCDDNQSNAGKGCS